jgi:hypothetical protein
MRKLSTFLIAACLIGCGGDDVHDKSPDEAMIREAMCVAASERFLLYKEASLHLKHGLEAGRFRFERTGKQNDFTKQVQEARQTLVNLSANYNAVYLKNGCNRRISQAEFNRG